MSKLHNTNLRNIQIILLVMCDIASVSLAIVSAYLLRNEGIFREFLDSVQPIETYLTALPFSAALLISIYLINGLYIRKKNQTPLTELYVILQSVSLWILLIMAGSYLLKYDYSRIIVILLFVLTLTYNLLFRYLFRNMEQKLFPDGYVRINTAVIGTGRLAKEIKKRLLRSEIYGLHFTGFIQTNAQELPRKNIIGSISSLNTLIKKYELSEIYIADSGLSHDRILTIIAKCSMNNVKFKVVSDMFDLITGNVDVFDLENIPTLDVGRVNFPLWKKIYKQLFDLMLASIALIIFLPVFIIVSVAIRLDSKGPVFISQKRIGHNGKPFKLYKFRTMRSNTPLYGSSPKQKEDVRITKIGKFLRKHSLDELPQLFNIIKGDMSFVGPRPEMHFIVRTYNAWEKRRLVVKPGLTGLWQILGRKDLPLTENLEYDFYYINNQSLFLDITILIKTIPVVLQGKGAY